MLPDYTAAQSFASGIVLLKCIEQAGSLADERLRRVAGELDFNTFYGRFRIDPLTGQQMGHQVLLTQWQGGAKRIAWPLEAAEEPTVSSKDESEELGQDHFHLERISHQHSR
jgi:branched-chain amino acid transport system substrate-binding protein